MAKKFKADSTAQPASISGSETPPTHGVGGGVISRKQPPALSETPGGNKTPQQMREAVAGNQSKLAAYLKKSAAKRVK